MTHRRDRNHRLPAAFAAKEAVLRRSSEALIIVMLVLLPLLFWWRLWALKPADRAVIPDGDLTSQYYPLQLFAAREVAAGRLPAWNPYINAGQPALADIQTGFFYPFNLLPNLLLADTTLLYPSGWPYQMAMLTAQVILHFSLASLFTYLYVRHLARRVGARLPAARFAGAIAAVVFTYSGYLTSFPVQQVTILETAVWLPLVLFFLDRAFHAARPLPQLLLAGLALACAFLAGHPQTAMYLVYAALAYALFLAWTTRTPQSATSATKPALRSAGFVALPFIVGAALASVQLVPTALFIVHSTRAGLDYDAVASGFPLAEMTHLLYPGYFGGSPQYVGILPLVLAAASLFVLPARREVAFWLVLGTVAFVLAFGGNTFLYNVAYLLAPGWGAVRNQERAIYLFAFSVSVLTGCGALVLVQPLARLPRKGFYRFVRGLAWVALVFLALTILFYYGYLQGEQQNVEVNLLAGVLRHHILLLLILGGSVTLFTLRQTGRARRVWLMTLALGLVWLNLFTINWRFNLAEPVAGGPFPQTGLTEFLKAQPGTFRLSSAGLLPGGASAGIVYELEDITGNTPLRLEAFQKFEDQVGSWRRWQLLNVHLVLSQDELDGPGLQRVYEEGEVRAYQVGDPLPRAWVVPNTVVAGDDQAIALLNAPEFDPRYTAVLPPESAELALQSHRADAVPGGNTLPAAAQVQDAVPGKLVLSVSPAFDGLLVISQPFYPGWRAEVDGQRVPLYRVDLLLQGVPIKAGSHRVELSYYLSPLPGLLTLGALVACLAGLILSGWLARRGR